MAEVEDNGGLQQSKERWRHPVREQEHDPHEDGALHQEGRLAHDAPGRLHEERTPGSDVAGEVAEAGEYVTVGSPVFEMFDDSRLFVRALARYSGYNERSRRFIRWM